MGTTKKEDSKSCERSGIRIKRKRSKAQLTRVVDVLKTINTQLTGINSNLNNNINSLTSVISNTDNNLNASLINSLNTLNASLNNTIETNTNTIISNMNNGDNVTCTVQQFNNSTNFDVPCGTSTTYFENLSASAPETVIIFFQSFQPNTNPCQPVLVVVTSEGSVLEEPISQTFSSIRVDNFSSISVRCESSVPPPAGAACNGFVGINEFFCVCC